MNSKQQPIGVFDSGVGGLSALRALREQMPVMHVPMLLVSPLHVGFGR